MTTREYCKDHVGFCESLARIEAKLDTVIESQEKQWSRLEALQERSAYRNGMERGQAKSIAVIAGGVSLAVSVLTLVLRALWLWKK